jgi:hypothetical protein
MPPCTRFPVSPLIITSKPAVIMMTGLLVIYGCWLANITVAAAVNIIATKVVWVALVSAQRFVVFE